MSSRPQKKKIFLSYSVEDTEIVRKVHQSLSPYAEVLFWDENKDLASTTWTNVSKWIDRCDFFLLLLTDPKVRRALDVGQELGRALTKDKPVFPLVGAEVDDAHLGFLTKSPYVKFKTDTIWDAAKELSAILAKGEGKSSPKYSDTEFILGSALIAMSAFLVSEG